MTTVSLEGVYSPGGVETRAIAHIDVTYNGELYHWQAYIPTSTPDLQVFMQEIVPKVEAEISAREAEWAALTPKTRAIIDSMSGETTYTDIDKSEIVKPDIPDYYAKRRDFYPPIGDQLDALWRGPASAEYLAVQAKITAVKVKYPKT